MKRVEVALLQHAPHEGGGIIEEEIRQQDIPFHRIEIFSTQEIPSLSATHLVVMGGAMSVNDEREYPWLVQEKQLIRNYIRRGFPVLGICLGAQLIAAAGGGKVSSCHTELGWSPVFGVLKGNSLVPDRFMAFQMHGETFNLPDGASLVCRGEQVEHQALALGSALGLQFHLELTEEMIQDWIADRLPTERRKILGGNRYYISESQRLCRQISARFLAAPPTGFTWIRDRD